MLKISRSWLCLVLSQSVVSDSLQPMTVALQAPPSMGFSRQEYWSGVPLPSPQQYVATGKTIALTLRTFVGRVKSLLFNTLYRFVIAFLPRSKRLQISRLRSPSTVILEPKKRKSVTTSTFSPSIWHEVMGPDAMILVFFILSFKPTLSLSSFTLIKRLLQFLFTFCH